MPPRWIDNKRLSCRGLELVNRSRLFNRTLWLVLGGLLLAAGCGEPATTAPKTDLSEKEKQQIRELNEQRAQEWGPKRK
jgi:hypothetical protein